MCGLVIFCRGIGKSVLPKTIHPCTSLISHPKQKWVSWHLHFLPLQLSVILPAIFLCNAQQSGKAGRKSHVKISEKWEHEVQQVLQNYLLYTRSLPFVDAEHISLYAPCFLQKLASRVNERKHISKALERYLLYNPINEFEPFFESIGVKTSELHRFLPPGKIYLNEDEFLLENVSTLSNSGFPRHVMGKLYEEHPELFSCSAAKLQKKLQFYEELGVNKVSLIRILTCCPSLLYDDVYRKFVTVANGLKGFQVEKNRICCLLEENPLKFSSILEKLMLLAGIGCPWDKINMLYRTHPQLFIYTSEKALYSIVDVLSNLGLRNENIGNIILHYPEILRWDPSKSTSATLNLSGVGLDQKEMIEMDLCQPHYLHAENLIKLIEDVNCIGLEKQRVAVFIRELLKSTMSMTPLSKASSEENQNIPSAQSELVHRRDDLVVRDAKLKHASGTQEISIGEILQEPIQRHKLNFLLKLGLLNYPERMIKFDREIRCGSNKLQEQLSCLLRIGFPFNVVCHMVRKEPRLMNKSTDLIQKKFDFLCSTTFDPLQSLTSFPGYFDYHLERRIKPRYKIYAWLKTNKLLVQECSLRSILQPSEDRFVQKIVNCHPEGSKYFSLCKLGLVMPRTPLSKVSSEKFQNILSGGSELVHRRDDLNVCDAKLKHASGTREINISKNLKEPSWRHKLNFLLKLGLLNYPERMINVDGEIYCGSNTLQERLSCLLRLGFPFNVVCRMVRSRPNILNQDVDLIQKKFDFLCSTTFDPLQSLTSFPGYFDYHLERRIKPRYKIYAWLKTNKLLVQECSLRSILQPSEDRFVQKIVDCHPEGSKYFSLCKLGLVMPRTPLSKVSSEKFQNILSGGSELVHRRDDLNVCDAKLKHASGTREINISKNLKEPSWRHKLNFLLKLGLLNYPERMINVDGEIYCGSNTLQERLSCLLRLGFPFNVVCRMVRSRPNILNQDVDLIQKKFDFLCSTTFDPLQSLTSFPGYFDYHLERRIKPRYKIYAWLKTNKLLVQECSLRSILQPSEDRFVQKIVNCHPEGSKYFSLCKLGLVMPRTPLSKVSSEKFQNILSGGSELVHRRDDLNVCDAKLKHASGTREINISKNLKEPSWRHKLNFLLKLGLLNYPERMINVDREIYCGSNTLQERLSCLLRLGFPFNVVCRMVRSRPNILNQDVDLIQKKFDFLCSTTFDPLQSLTSFPSYFDYHLERRIKPRYKIYAWLKTNELLEQECSLRSILEPSEDRFLQKYVNCHPEEIMYFSLCKLGLVMPRTPLSKVSSEKFQNILSGGSEVVHRRDDLNVCDAKLKHAAVTQEINISENLQEPIGRHKLNFLLKLGLLNYPEQMIKVDREIHCGSNKLQERLSCLLRLGFPFNAICQMVRSRPMMLRRSADLIQKKFDFLCSITSNPLQVLTPFPHYFCYHLEGRIKPRYQMYAWLKANNLLNQECSFQSIFGPSEVRFVQKYVNCHPEGSKYFSLCKLKYFSLCKLGQVISFLEGQNSSIEEMI